MRIIKYNAKGMNNWLKNCFIGMDIDIFSVIGNTAWIEIDYHPGKPSKTVSRKIDKNFQFKFSNTIFDLSECPSATQIVNAYFERKTK